LKVIEAFKRFGRGCKPRPASVLIKTEAINQSVVCFVIAIHGNWIPANPRFALPAGMTGLNVFSYLISLHHLILPSMATGFRQSLPG
jgi:hypothetical protein